MEQRAAEWDVRRWESAMPSRGAQRRRRSGERGGRLGATAGAAQAATVLKASTARQRVHGIARRGRTRFAKNASARDSDTKGGDHGTDGTRGPEDATAYAGLNALHMH